jgi:ribosomal protein S18 acetylase RimI-like enzyme
VFKANSAVWYGKVLSPADSPAVAVAARSGRTAAVPDAAPSRPGYEASDDFAVVDPLELAGWLRHTEGLAWAADERELEVAAACGHRWTSWAPGGRTAAFCKVGGGRVFIVDFDRAFGLPSRIAYISDVYVMSRMRRKGIGRALLEETLRFLIDDSFTGVACHIPRSNAASARLFGSLGFAPLGEVRFTRVLGIPFFSTRPERLLEKMASGCGSPGSGPRARSGNGRGDGRPA